MLSTPYLHLTTMKSWILPGTFWDFQFGRELIYWKLLVDFTLANLLFRIIASDIIKSSKFLTGGPPYGQLFSVRKRTKANLHSTVEIELYMDKFLGNTRENLSGFRRPCWQYRGHCIRHLARRVKHRIRGGKLYASTGRDNCR